MRSERTRGACVGRNSHQFRPLLFLATFSIENAFINIWALTGTDLHKSTYFMSDSRHALPNASSVQTLRSTTATKLNDPNIENKTSFMSNLLIYDINSSQRLCLLYAKVMLISNDMESEEDLHALDGMKA